MKTITSLLTLTFFSILLTGCVNKHGVSAKYYSDCKEYYDLQGYYHKECGEDDIFTYKGASEGIGEGIKNTLDKIDQAFHEKKPRKNKIKNVW